MIMPIKQQRSLCYVTDTQITVPFLQRGRIACNAERCINHGNSVCPFATRWYPIDMNEDKIMRSSI